MSALLARRGCAVTALASLEEAYTVLKRLASQPTSFTAVVLGWPEYADGVAEDVFGLLHGDHYEHLPVLVLADAGSAGAVNWRMTRPRTALLQWNEYHEAADALDELLRPPPAAAPALEPAGHLRILLVDDSATVRMAFSRLLARYGYVVDTADGVAEGMEKARQAVYDIAIVDYFMPGANGTQLIAALQRDPQTAHVL
ncbi:MAG: response regulator, partial [Xanthomonadales bacterium]|nr:response regulator [Xanthomonadales bacterium]